MFLLPYVSILFVINTITTTTKTLSILTVSVFSHSYDCPVEQSMHMAGAEMLDCPVQSRLGWTLTMTTTNCVSFSLHPGGS